MRAVTQPALTFRSTVVYTWVDALQSFRFSFEKPAAAGFFLPALGLAPARQQMTHHAGLSEAPSGTRREGRQDRRQRRFSLSFKRGAVTRKRMNRVGGGGGVETPPGYTATDELYPASTMPAKPAESTGLLLPKR